MQQNQSNSITVYRGQTLDKNVLERLKSSLGCLISTNTIISTTCNYNVACGFGSDPENGVIFEINIPNTDNNILHPFTDISKLSSMSYEEEILFFAGAVFRIDSVNK